MRSVRSSRLNLKIKECFNKLPFSSGETTGNVKRFWSDKNWADASPKEQGAILEIYCAELYKMLTEDADEGMKIDDEGEDTIMSSSFMDFGSLHLAEFVNRDEPIPFLMEIKLGVKDPEATSSQSSTVGADFIDTFVAEVQNCVSMLAKLEGNKLGAIALISDPYMDRGVYYCNMRIQMPYFVINYHDYDMILKSVIEHIRKRNVLSYHKGNDGRDLEDMINNNPYSDGKVFLQGSVDNPSIPPLIPYGIYADPKKFVGRVEHIFDVRSHSTCGSFFSDKFHENDDINVCPIFCSLSFSKTLIPLKSTATIFVRSETTSIISKTQDYLWLLKPERKRNLVNVNEVALGLKFAAKQEFDFCQTVATIEAGYVHKELDLFFNEAKQIFKDWMKEAMTEAECEAYWENIIVNQYSDDSITYKTIAWYAMLDNSTEFYRIRKEEIDKTTLKCIKDGGTDMSIAIVAHEILWLNYIYCKSSGGWFEFSRKDHRWVLDQEALDLQKKLFEILLKHFGGRNVLLLDMKSTVDGRDLENIKKETSILGSILKRISSIGGISSIIRCMATLFNNTSFTSIVNMNSSLTGTSNGVIEISSGKAYLRDGKPEDWITMTTGVSVRRELPPDDPLVKEINEWMSQVFVDPGTRKFAWNYFSSMLYGKNSDKKFTLHSGVGNNSKSMIFLMLENCLGKYCVKLPTSIASGKRAQSSAANPEYVMLLGAKLAIIQEPSSNESINTAVIKELTGNDTYFARGLYQSGGKQKSTHKLCYICNVPPTVQDPDMAIKNRVIVLPYLSKWTKDCPVDEDEQYAKRIFKLDEYFENRIPLLAPTFLTMLMRNYENYTKEKLKYSKEIIESTSMYWSTSDVYASFIKENVRKDPETVDTPSTFKLAEAYKLFRSWYRIAYPNTGCPQKNAFYRGIEDNLTRATADMEIVGYRLMMNEVAM